MNQKLKDSLAYVAIFALVVFAYSSFVYVRSYARTQPAMNTFSVNGDGKVVASPDIAQFTFSIIDQGGKDMSAIKTSNDAKSKKVVEALKTLGVDTKDIKTDAYNIEPRYQYSNCTFGRTCPPAEIVGYTITQGYTAKIRDFAKINSIVSGVVTAGANNVSQISFGIDDPTKYKDEARALAIEKAQKQASAIAKAAGFRIGRLVSVDEMNNAERMSYVSYAPKALGMGGGDVAVSSLPQIEPGSQDVVVNVNMRYEIN